MAELQKGIISTIEGNFARVSSPNNPDDVSMPLQIAPGVSGIKKESIVVYAVFDDGTGIILGEMEE